MNLKITQYISIFFVIMLLGCGYKPSSHAIKRIFSDKIYVNVIVDSAEPENAPFIRDELSRLVISRISGEIALHPQKTNTITVSYRGTTFTPLGYDEYGYVVRYQTIVKANFTFVDKNGKKWSKMITSISDESISDNAVHASALRIESIKTGLVKTVDEFMAYLSAKGALEESH
ncbi:MAG: hypothetical protein P8Y35_03790 [Sulfurovaceae bacterium]|jgi:hypothetical protein